jgi:sulfite reductase alpha subunit-like flavoprotein
VQFAKQFGVNIKRKFKWAKNKEFLGRQPNTPFPIDSTKGITVAEALTTFIDLQGPISKKLLKDMLPHCRSLEDREKIEVWTKLGDKTFDADILKKQIGVRDLKSVLPSLSIKADFILQKFPTIMPRYYTIASSSLAHPTDLAMAISLTSW